MGATILERILARTSGKSAVRPGEVAVCRPDMVVHLDLPMGIEGAWYRPTRVFDRERRRGRLRPCGASAQHRGRVLEREQDAARGTATRPFSPNVLEDKFRRLASVLLPQDQVQQIMERVARLEDVRSMAELVPALVTS